MAEQRMKVRDKKVQKMTKDGLVEENLTDKSSVRVSNRASDVQMGRKQGEVCWVRKWVILQKLLFHRVKSVWK